MSFEADLRTFLLTVDPITALVNQQIYGVMRPQGNRPLPELLFYRTGTTRQVKFCGTDSLVASDFQIDSYAIDGDGCFALAEAVRLALVDYRGNMGDSYVDQVTLSNEFPMNDPDPGIIRMCQLYSIWYQEV